MDDAEKAAEEATVNLAIGRNFELLLTQKQFEAEKIKSFLQGVSWARANPEQKEAYFRESGNKIYSSADTVPWSLEPKAERPALIKSTEDEQT